MISSDETNLDLKRTDRIGFGEAVFCTNKTPTQIDAILDLCREEGGDMLITRLAPGKHIELADENKSKLDYDPVSETGFFQFQRTTTLAAQVAIVTSGTSDVSVAREAERTLAFNKIGATLIFDVGVAGLWRLTSRLEEIRAYPVIIAIAGMDAAMISILGGLVRSLLIAVPTSTGYGVARNGETALAASLSSCAPGVVVCNIDNGYGAACAAIRALQSIPFSPQIEKG